MATDSPKASCLLSPGMVLRSGRTPGRTPQRMRTPGSAASDMSMGMELSWGLPHGRETQDLLASFGADLHGEAEGIMHALGDGESMNLLNGMGMDLTMSPLHVLSPALQRQMFEHDVTRLVLSPGAKATEATLVEIRHGGLMDADMAGARIRPFHASPYAMRSNTASPMVGFACHDIASGPLYGDGMSQKTSKRKLQMADAHGNTPLAQLAAVAGPAAVDQLANSTATMPSAAVALASGSPGAYGSHHLLLERSGGSAKKDKKLRDKRTAAAPKRGEYKCGKCGYFPKKEKHNCDSERQKRIASGTFPDPKLAKDAKNAHLMGSGPFMHPMAGGPGGYGMGMGMGDPMLGYMHMPQQQQQHAHMHHGHSHHSHAQMHLSQQQQQQQSSHGAVAAQQHQEQHHSMQQQHHHDEQHRAHAHAHYQQHEEHQRTHPHYQQQAHMQVQPQEVHVQPH